MPDDHVVHGFATLNPGQSIGSHHEVADLDVLDRLLGPVGQEHQGPRQDLPANARKSADEIDLVTSWERNVA
jgi:hypothetical protein